MGWLQFIIALFGFLKQLLAYWNNQEERKIRLKAKAEKLKQFKAALKKANNGDTSDLEELFSVITSSDSGGGLPDDKGA